MATLIATETASGQTVFFDDFNGSELLPHWVLTPFPGALQYNVGGGMLNVTGLPYPSNPKSPSNHAGLQASFAPSPGDFQAVARLGWDAGTQRGLFFSVTGLGGLLGSMGYSEASSGAVVQVRTGSTQPINFSAPGPGLHDFSMVRAGAAITFLVDGNPLIALPEMSNLPVSEVLLGFIVSYPNAGFSQLNVDRVHVVPSPGTLSLAAGLLLSGCARRRR